MSVRLGALDGLRGIAIALVVWFHIWQLTWLRADVPFTGGALNFNAVAETGFLGVDLFFFISGFCLFLPYANARAAGVPAPTLAAFAYRRALKILPSYVLAICAMTALGLGHFGSLGEALRELGLHLLFIHVWFPQSFGSINGVLWSLGVEVQFYVLFPALAWCALRRPLATFAGLALVANLYRFGVRDLYDAQHLMNQLPGSLDIFGAGMLAAYGHSVFAARAPSARERAVWSAVSGAGFLLCLIVVQGAYDARLMPDWPYHWYAFGRPLLTLALPAVALGALLAWPAWQRALANPALVFLSLVSYNLYLWHAAVVHAVYDARFPPWQEVAAHSDPGAALSFTFVSAAVAIAVAALLTFALERPLLRKRPFAPRSVRVRPPSLAHTFEGPLAVEP